MTFVSASQFHAYLPWVSVLKIHKCESVSSRFQQGAQSRGPLCDYDPLCGPSFEALARTQVPQFNL